MHKKPRASRRQSYFTILVHHGPELAAELFPDVRAWYDDPYALRRQAAAAGGLTSPLGDPDPARPARPRAEPWTSPDK